MGALTSIPPLLRLVFSSLFFALGEVTSKHFALAPSWRLVALVLVLYAVGTCLWLPAILQTKQLALTGALWSVLSLVATVLIGVFYFQESFSPLGILGMALALAAVICLSLA